MKLYFSAALCSILLAGCGGSSSTSDNIGGDFQDTVMTGSGPTDDSADAISDTPATGSNEVINDVCVDTNPIGDGWGWNGTTSCQVVAIATPEPEPTSEPEPTL